VASGDAVIMEPIESAAPMTSPENSAVRLIDHYQGIEAELTKMETLPL